MGSARGRRPGGKPKKTGPSGRTRPDPLFGDVPAVWLAYDEAGRCGCWAADPAYRPKLPPGAVRGDIAKQIYCRLCHVPRYYYVDQKKVCVQCGREFVFFAREQKYWFETLHFHFNTTAIRCPECRRQRRTQSALSQQLAEATRAVDAAPQDPAVLLDFAQAVARHYKECGGGDLAGAVAACRTARRHAPDLVAAWYWEGICQRLAGRAQRAREALEQFIAAAVADGRYERLVTDARRMLQGRHSAGS